MGRTFSREWNIPVIKDPLLGPRDVFCQLRTTGQVPDNRYEATCRYFKSRKSPPEPPRHYHNNLIDEAEEELRALSWPELMTAGGLAGVTAWIVSSATKG